ncbi:MAG: L-2-hydroxyglutarate oxidase [Chlamydiae bacterium]|nr:L-2-hydroxyglutarate oxidase [Chlamydiota bacterium]MBI3266888.1 L-2-hydroxyglutarate oxidase [Chlamydiota bacterium]
MKQVFDIAIVGAGVVGSALARELGQRFGKVLLLDKENAVAFHTSGRNSGVIHSGFNQKPGTLKARLCVEGSRLTREYCREKGVPCKEVGTYVMAMEESELKRLEELKARGEKNGVPGLEILSIEKVHEREPRALGLTALFSPTGAIVDSVKLVQSLVQDAQERGVVLRLGEEVKRVEEGKEGVCLFTQKDRYDAKLLINCAGLHADRLAHLMGLGREYAITPFRGEYFEANGTCAKKIHAMIYPVPHPEFPFLGIHVTPTVHGTIILGPNAVLAAGREAYGRWSFNFRDVFRTLFHGGFLKAFFKNSLLRKVAWHELKNSCSKQHFFREASRLVEGFQIEDFSLAKRVGIRPQLIRKDGQFVDDLVIEQTPHSLHLLNVVSPGMTSAIPFAQWLSKGIDNVLCWKCPWQEAA